MKNTCSIKLLKNVHIGGGIRMTKDSTTVAFDNKPMVDLVIEQYNKMGFYISHSSLPKNIWVDFDQLPLTRLEIKNGVIKDEITFVENIVIHRMQLIKTMDTEYIELLYNEAQLAKKEADDEIIPLKDGIPGHIYKGAQCEDGAEMIFLGTYFTKNIIRKNNRWERYHSRSDQYLEDYRISSQSPRRAYFLTTDKSGLSQQEDQALKTQHHLAISESFYDRNSGGFGLSDENKKIRRVRIDGYLKAKAALILANQSKNDHYSIRDYPATSKRIKKLIKTGKTESRFEDTLYSKDVIFQGSNFTRIGAKADRDRDPELKVDKQLEIGIHITNEYYRRCDGNYIQQDKKDIDMNAIKFINENYNITLNESNPIDND